jgi:hypothetical protein
LSAVIAEKFRVNDFAEIVGDDAWLAVAYRPPTSATDAKPASALLAFI